MIIVVEGNIGAGKSTILEQLMTKVRKDEDDREVIFHSEPIDIYTSVQSTTCPTPINLLEKVYVDPSKYTFQFQLVAALNNLNELLQASKDIDKIHMFERSWLFGAHVMLPMLKEVYGEISDEDYSVYYHLIENHPAHKTVRIDKTIYLDTPIDVCMKRINQRGRLEERNVSREYVANIGKYYEKWIEGGKNMIDVLPNDTAEDKKKGMEKLLKILRPHYFFYGYGSPMSQWHARYFNVNNVIYNSAEQFMMVAKALLMEDYDMALLIKSKKSPFEMKKLGRNVKNFDEQLWNRYKRDVVYRGNMMKFGQNKDLRDKLFATFPSKLVEASPFDTTWGIGLTAKVARHMDPSDWIGYNLLGEILTKVRNDLMKEEQRIGNLDHYTTGATNDIPLQEGNYYNSDKFRKLELRYFA